jgi:hypothetical protein
MLHRPLVIAVILGFLLGVPASGQEAPSNDAVFSFGDPDGALVDPRHQPARRAAGHTGEPGRGDRHR